MHLTLKNFPFTAENSMMREMERILAFFNFYHQLKLKFSFMDLIRNRVPYPSIFINKW